MSHTTNWALNQTLYGEIEGTVVTLVDAGLTKSEIDWVFSGDDSLLKEDPSPPPHGWFPQGEMSRGARPVSTVYDERFAPMTVAGTPRQQQVQAVEAARGAGAQRVPGTPMYEIAGQQIKPGWKTRAADTLSDVGRGVVAPARRAVGWLGDFGGRSLEAARSSGDRWHQRRVDRGMQGMRPEARQAEIERLQQVYPPMAPTTVGGHEHGAAANIAEEPLDVGPGNVGVQSTPAMNPVGPQDPVPEVASGAPAVMPAEDDPRVQFISNVAGYKGFGGKGTRAGSLYDKYQKLASGGRTKEAFRAGLTPSQLKALTSLSLGEQDALLGHLGEWDASAPAPRIGPSLDLADLKRRGADFKLPKKDDDEDEGAAPPIQTSAEPLDMAWDYLLKER